MEWYKIGKKNLEVLGSVLNKPEKINQARVFHIPIDVWNEWKKYCDVGSTTGSTSSESKRKSAASQKIKSLENEVKRVTEKLLKFGYAESDTRQLQLAKERIKFLETHLLKPIKEICSNEVVK